MEISKILERNKKIKNLKENPELGLLNLFEVLESTLKNNLNETFSSLKREMSPEQINQLKADVIKEFIIISEALKKKLEEELNSKNYIEKIRGFRGEPGKDADEQAIISQIMPKIKEAINLLRPKHGKTPSKSELLTLIKLAMPEVKNGETPSDKRLLSLITPLIKNNKVGGKEIILEVNSLPIERKYQIGKEHIRDLVEDMNKLRMEVRKKQKKGGGGGGGMGNAINETFSLTPSTSTIVLANKVAAGGKAFWGYYNGAYIVPGTGFTMGVDKKTITLLFTPEADTFIDCVYIRG